MSGVLVTGASGFIGGHLSRRLAQSGVEVHAISRAVRHGTGVRWRQCDLTEFAGIAALMSELRPEIIYHFAGLNSGSRSLDDALSVLEHNLVGTVNLLVAATQARCGLVLTAGSMEEPEADAAATSPYAAAKQAVRAHARMFGTLYGLKILHLRIFMVYGPGQREPKLVPGVVMSLLRNDPPELTSGTRPVDWVYIDDVVDAVLAAGERPELAGQSIDIGSGTQVTVKSLVEEIVEIVGADVAPRFGALPDRPLETVPEADVRRTYELLGWRPQVSLSEGLRRTVASYRAEIDGLVVSTETPVA